ncbi:ABC transporter substrate-binding protein [Streptomyces cavernae]|uniref:ABC transporter substrate-binding protein n=1 Tax=Streptomyces cavernae TaxID=2259034 RepID=UPI000FEB717F|nr:ABC transporter substrate-binding protein [Streptomyces cavernae]
MHKSRTLGLAAVALASALAVAGCSTKAERAGTSSAAPGVSDSTIKLGVLMDLSGPFAGTGKTILDASNVAVKEINAAGGVCDRKLALVTRDHGYDPQKAVAAYDEMDPQVLGYLNILGTPVVTALRDKIEAKDELAGLTTFASTLLGDKHLIVLGATYDIQTINGLDWLVRKGELRSGDSVGHIYLQGEIGENSLRGSKFAAGKLGLKIVGQQIDPTATDLTSQVNALKSAKVKAIQVDSTPKQAASVAAVAQAAGMEVPIMGGVSTFATSLLTTSAAPALTEHYTRLSGLGALGADTAAARKLAAAWTDQYGKAPEASSGVVHAYAMTKLYAEILGKTCEDLTRPGLLKARSAVTDFTLPGLLPPQDFSDPAEPSSREAQVLGVDKDVFAGVKPLGDFFASDLAKEYKVPSAG